MRYNYTIVAVIYYLFSLNGNVLSQQNDGSKRILFVGNSYTYQWNLPQQVAAMSRETGDDLYVRQSTAGGVTWGQHWRGEKGLTTREKIKSGDYDIVVLQNHSMRTIVAPDSMMLYGKMLAQEIRHAGAEPMLFMTWGRVWNPLMIDTVSEVYQEVGQEIGALVVPVGNIWQEVRLQRPELTLHQPDGSHQTPTGMYIAACAFYSALTGKTPVGLSPRNFMEDANGERVYLNIQSANDAQYLQEVVKKHMQEVLD